MATEKSIMEGMERIGELLEEAKRLREREMNFDMRLEPRRRQREESEQDQLLEEQYRDYLSEKDVYELLDELTVKQQDSIKDDLIDRIVELRSGGKDDKEFCQGVDWEELGWEEY